MRMSSRVLLYLDMWAGDLVHERKLLGLRHYADMRGWNVVPVGERDSRPDRIAGLFAKYHPVGCIIECSSGHVDLVPKMFRGIPTVWLDCRTTLHGGRMPRVCHDNEATTREAFRELSTNFPMAYAAVGHEEDYFWSRIRVRAFRRLVQASGKTCLIFTTPERGRRRIQELAVWVGNLPRKCAVFAVNDVVAREVLDACREAGRWVPSDLTLVGVDNHEFVCKSTSPTISSVQIDFEQAGYRAAMLVDDLMAGQRERERSFGPLMTIRRESTRGFVRREGRMQMAIDMIRREACNGLCARDVVKTFGGSRRLVDLRFRETFGHSILDEIQNVRFEKVLLLLSRTQVSIGAIADQCGFGSVITLREQFRKRMGMSMRQWRLANGIF